HAVKILIALALYQRMHTGAPGSLYKGKTSEIGDIHPVVGDSLYYRRLVCGDHQFDSRAGLFLEIFHEWLAFAHDLSGIGGRDHGEPKGVLGPTTTTTCAADCGEQQNYGARERFVVHRQPPRFCLKMTQPGLKEP